MYSFWPLLASYFAHLYCTLVHDFTLFIRIANKDVDVDLAPTLILGHDKVKGHEKQPEVREEKHKCSECYIQLYELMRIEMPEAQEFKRSQTVQDSVKHARQISHVRVLILW